MKKNRFEIKLDLQQKLPDDFLIKYDELNNWHYGKYKPDPTLESSPFKLKIRSWKEVEIIYNNTKMIAGKFNVKAIDRSGEEIDIPFHFIVAKLIKENSKNRVRWKTLYEFFNNFTQKEIDSVNRKVVDQLMPECFERIRQHEE